jgi:hypothetical protein
MNFILPSLLTRTCVRLSACHVTCAQETHLAVCTMASHPPLTIADSARMPSWTATTRPLWSP